MRWVERPAMEIEGVRTRCHLSESDCAVLVAKEPAGWHLSISHPERYPTWDEIKEARYRFTPSNVTMAMILPPPEQYVNVHSNCFHLHEIERAGALVLP